MFGYEIYFYKFINQIIINQHIVLKVVIEIGYLNLTFYLFLIYLISAFDVHSFK